jgi:hypothetical protein
MGAQAAVFVGSMVIRSAQTLTSHMAGNTTHDGGKHEGDITNCSIISSCSIHGQSSQLDGFLDW